MLHSKSVEVTVDPFVKNGDERSWIMKVATSEASSPRAVQR